MKARPPKRSLTPKQELAASSFVEAAESTGSGSGRVESVSDTSIRPESRSSRMLTGRPDESSERPWEDPRVREDVMKGYALRLPEPLYLKLKWVAERTGRSINAVCREAVEEEVGRHLPI